MAQSGHHNEIAIRAYRDQDWAAVCDIHDRARPFEIGIFVPATEILPMVEVAADEGFFDGKIYVAISGETLVGFICIDGDELTWLYVDPEYHGHGIGRALVAHIRPQLGPDGYLTAVVENEGGVRFYERLGFEAKAVFPGSCQGYPCTCIRLTLPSSRHAHRPPRPVEASLRLAGYSEDDWGEAYQDADAIWRWRPKSQ